MSPQEHCCCGNVLRLSRVTVRSSPCKCGRPGPGPSVTKFRMKDYLRGVTETAYDERPPLGLPFKTGSEQRRDRTG